jgi:glycerol uptake facilitator-like aquaporin
MILPYATYRKECLSELVGTYLLVLIGPSSVIVASLIPEFNALQALIFVASSFGGTVAIVIVLFGKYSAQINPAVTLAHGLANLTRHDVLVLYLCFQLTGALLAGLTLRLVFGSSGLADSLGSTKLAVGVNPFIGFMLELIGTFFLASSALLASGYVRGAVKQAALVGTTLFVLILLIGPITGAGFNPARTLGPSLASGYFANQIVYWTGPLLGAALAGLVYAVYSGKREKRKSLITLSDANKQPNTEPESIEGIGVNAQVDIRRLQLTGGNSYVVSAA